MTGDEIIALARVHFGEATANTLTDPQMGEFLNHSAKDLYERLPPSRMKNLVTVAAVALVDGRGPIPTTYDKVMGVYIDGAPGALVPLPVIKNVDVGMFYAPGTGIFAIDDSHVWVRPKTAGCEVQYIAPPSEYDHATQKANEFASFSANFHPALAALTASLAYAQEEDLAQAQHYRAEYLQSISSVLGTEEGG